MGALERARSALASRVAWVVLATVVAGALAVGSVHAGPQGAAARIAHLDSVVKCPSCEDLSIAQSEASTAVALRSFVAAGVRAGESDSQIEDAVVARYGQGILLSPRNILAWVLPVSAAALAAVLVGLALWRRGRRTGVGEVAPGGEGVAGEDAELVAAALAGRRGSDGDVA